MLKKAGTLQEEAQRFEAKAQHLESCGLEKMEAAVAGSEVEGFYGLLRGAMSCSSISSAPPPPRKSATHHLPPSPIHPPQESQEPKASSPAEWAPESSSVTVPPVLEGGIPANMQPLHIQLGALRESIDVRLRAAGRAHQPPTPPYVCI